MLNKGAKPKSHTSRKQICSSMKTKAFIVGIFSVALITFLFSFKSSDGGSSMIIIKTIEKPSGTAMQNSTLAVYKDGSVIEQIDLKDLHGKSIDNNLKIVGDQISKYQSEGYELISSAGAGGTNTLTFNYILIRK